MFHSQINPRILCAGWGDVVLQLALKIKKHPLCKNKLTLGHNIGGVGCLGRTFLIRLEQLGSVCLVHDHDCLVVLHYTTGTKGHSKISLIKFQAGQLKKTMFFIISVMTAFLQMGSFELYLEHNTTICLFCFLKWTYCLQKVTNW